MTEVIKTKYGNATLNDYGYYHITSGKEGNHCKYLHRLIFEDFYNIKLNEEFPEGIIIHHVDGNKTNNEIWNLIPIPLSEHSKLHRNEEEEPFYSKPKTLSHKMRISQQHNTTGIFRVLPYTKGVKYAYYDSDNKRKWLTAPTLNKLKEKVLEKGFEWIVLDETLAKQTEKKYLEKYLKTHENHSSGIKRVRKKKSKTAKQGFIWEYVAQKDNKRLYISSIDLDKLKEKVLARGLKWEVIEEEC